MSQWYVIRQAHGRGIRVPTLMPRDIFLYATAFCDYFDSVFAVGVTRDGQQLAVFRHTFVFLNDMFGNFQQTDVTFCTRFLAFGLNPQMTIKRDFPDFLSSSDTCPSSLTL